MTSYIPDIILEETKHFSDDLLSDLQQDELTHLANEFDNYKALYPIE